MRSGVDVGASRKIGASPLPCNIAEKSSASITCNYDGVNKFQTTIGDGAFIGSNTALVAPVEVGRNATVGAGSVLTSAVPDEALAVARGKQRNVEGWKRPKKKS